MDFDKSEIYQFLPFFMLIGWMMFVQNYVAVYHPDMEQAAGWSGMILIFASIELIDVIYMRLSGEYPYIDAICNNYPNNKLRFYMREAIIDQPVEQGYYATTITLNWAIKHRKTKGKVERLHIHHRGLWAERVTFHPGRAMLWGESVSHPQVANLWLEEVDLMDIERVKGEPIFELARGNMDETSAPIMTDEFKNWLNSNELGKRDFVKTGKNNIETTNSSGNIEHQTRLLVKENQQLLRKNRELKRRSMKDHMLRLAVEETQDLTKNELGAVLDIPTKFQAAVVRFVLALWEAFGGIDNVVKTWGKGKVTMTKWVSVTVLGIAVLVFFYINPEPVQKAYDWLSMGNNQVFILLFGAIAAAGIYLYSRKKK